MSAPAGQRIYPRGYEIEMQSRHVEWTAMAADILNTAIELYGAHDTAAKIRAAAAAMAAGSSRRQPDTRGAE